MNSIYDWSITKRSQREQQTNAQYLLTMCISMCQVTQSPTPIATNCGREFRVCIEHWFLMALRGVRFINSYLMHIWMCIPWGNLLLDWSINCVIKLTLIMCQLSSYFVQKSM